MKVKRLIKLLSQENQNADVLVYVAAEEGYNMVGVGLGDACLGRVGDNSQAVVIPADATCAWNAWED